MDKETFSYTLKMTKTPLFLVSQCQDMRDGTEVIELWIIDEADRTNRHLIETIKLDRHENGYGERITTKVTEYNEWFNELTGRKIVDHEA